MADKLKVGAHASISQGFNNAVKDILNIKGNAVQVFLKNPRGGKLGKPLDDSDVNKTRELLDSNNAFLVGHSSYLLNFAKSAEEIPWAIESLVDDINRIHKLGGKGVVLHMGKTLKYSIEEARKNMVRNTEKVLEKTPKETFVVWENTAGQGTEMGYDFKDLGEVYKQAGENPRIKFCLDTCHSFAAGYDLSSREGVRKWKEDFDNYVGWEEVFCIHINDSLRELGSKIDRHENLLNGNIAEEGFKEISKIAYETGKPLILETPIGYSAYEKEIEMIKKWTNN